MGRPDALDILVERLSGPKVDNRREKDHGQYQDLLSRLFEVNKEKPNEMSDNVVLSMATSNVFAGSDTTAISLRSIVYYLLRNPVCKKKFIAEIEERKKHGELSDPVKIEKANEMPYLQACMSEGLRLHPAVGMSLPRVVPAVGIEIDGKFLPAGTIVGVNPWVVHRDQEIFGKDVESFRPEMWLEGDRSDMDRFFFAFGSGARVCLGRNISWMEMSKLVPTLFSKFDLQLADPEASWKEACW
jgi:cytochrome P450